MPKVKDFGYARSGDKGTNANIGVIAYSESDYDYLKAELTRDVVKECFEPLGAKTVIRYELDNLLALNFVILDVLGGGGALSLRSDAQGKALGQTLLEIEI
ncbi:MAG: hypothetical protein KDK62_01770 [Chlamydiia bacterium]|nr:hypothetical protein [Chlamydiia bacterium]